MRRRGLLVVLSGPAGSGKSTLAEDLVAAYDDICRTVTATTRPPRPGEQDGRDYHFLTREEFEERLKRGYFVEHAEFNGNLYGTPKEELEQRLAADEVVLLVIDVQGASQVRESLPHAVFIFVLPPGRKALGRRLAGRATEKVSEIENRLKIAEHEVECLEEYDYLVINDDESAATDELFAIISMARTHHIRGGEREAWLHGLYEDWHQADSGGGSAAPADGP